MTFRDSAQIKKETLDIKEQSCRALFKDYYCQNIIMQILFWGTFDESLLEFID